MKKGRWNEATGSAAGERARGGGDEGANHQREIDEQRTAQNRLGHDIIIKCISGRFVFHPLYP